MTEEQMNALVKAMDGEAGRSYFCLLLIKIKLYGMYLGALRLELARQLELLDKNEYKFLWVTEFPLFEWSDEEQNRLCGNASSIYNADGRGS